MKKFLFASTALIAFGAVSAQAAEPIKLQLGGSSQWWVGYASQNERFENTAAQPNYTAVDVQGDNEVFFQGSTKLDNGIKVGVEIQLEAGGATDTTGGDTIDESFVTVEGGFGKVILGSKDNGAYLLHVGAPDAAGNLEEGNPLGGQWVVNPGISLLDTTAILTGGDSEKITYVSPAFAGFTVGATYVPDAGTEDSRTVTDNSATTGAGTSIALGGQTYPLNANEAYGAGAAYNNTFGGVGVKASVGYVVADVKQAAGTATYTKDTEWSAGSQISYAGFTLGGAYRDLSLDQNGTGTAFGDFEGNAWDVAVQYETGPFAVSLAYFQSVIDANEAANKGNKDVTRLIQASGKYSLSPGVDVLASTGHITFDGADTAASSLYNSGWYVTSGLALTF